MIKNAVIHSFPFLPLGYIVRAAVEFETETGKTFYTPIKNIPAAVNYFVSRNCTEYKIIKHGDPEQLRYFIFVYCDGVYQGYYGKGGYSSADNVPTLEKGYKTKRAAETRAAQFDDENGFLGYSYTVVAYDKSGFCDD